MYRSDEKLIKCIIDMNLRPTDPDQTISLIIYYKTKIQAHPFIKNRHAPPPAPLQEDHVIYEHTCTIGNLGPRTYSGMTPTKLARRRTSHVQDGAMRNYYTAKHRTTQTRHTIEEITKKKSIEKLTLALMFLNGWMDKQIVEERRGNGLREKSLQYAAATKRKK